MKKIINYGVLALFMLLINAGGVLAFDVSATVDLNSAYVWRGITLNDGLVMQPSLDVNKSGFGINVWGNMDIDDYNDTLESWEFSQVNFMLSYDFNFKPVDVSIGYIEYMFPAGGDGTREIYITLGKHIFKGLSGNFRFYYDFDEADDIYANASLDYSIPFSEKVNLDFGALVGYAGKDFARGDESGFHVYTLSAVGSYLIYEWLKVSAFLAYTDSIDEDVLPDQDVNFYGGLGITYNF